MQPDYLWRKEYPQRYMEEAINPNHKKRYDKTLKFLNDHVPPPGKILDLGTRNPFSELMEAKGYEVTNTAGEDLDTDYQFVAESDAELVTAFEIFEHLLAPFNVLRTIKAKKLVASVPLSLWFAKAYWNEKVEWDRHYHEFEPRQFDWLLEKAGWKIIKSEKWTSPVNKLGFRPILRQFTPRYYIVYCERTT